MIEERKMVVDAYVIIYLNMSHSNNQSFFFDKTFILTEQKNTEDVLNLEYI